MSVGVNRVRGESFFRLRHLADRGESVTVAAGVPRLGPLAPLATWCDSERPADTLKLDTAGRNKAPSRDRPVPTLIYADAESVRGSVSLLPFVHVLERSYLLWVSLSQQL